MIEDSQHLRDAVVTGLSNAGLAVDSAETGTDGLWRAQGDAYDVIILDLMLPGINGLEILRQLRAQAVQSHILILSAKDTVDDRVRGLQLGADDYLVKPFAFDELLARVHVLTRRKHGVKHPVLRVAGLDIDISARIASRDGIPIELAPREFALLEYLVLRRGEVVSRSDIEAHIYDETVEPMSNVVDSAICALRRRIDAQGKPSIIRTRRGMGYTVIGGES